MKTQDIRKRVIWKMTLFVTTVFLLAVAFQACQKDEMMTEPEEIGLKEGLVSEIILDYPDAVAAGKDFDITYSASCGKIMIERGYTLEVNPETGETTKVYAGLGCDTQNLLWEPIGADEYISCQGETITQNLAEPGTYVYRAKLNFKAIKDTGCEDCDFRKNQFECFTITVAASSSLATFEDERDKKVYKIVTLGTQTWMAENLAYLTETGSVAYGSNEANVALYGRLYSWDAAMNACPTGWHLPSNEEWELFIAYIKDNYGQTVTWGSEELTAYAKAVASTTGWAFSEYEGAPGNDPATNNASGFNAMPAGYMTSTMAGTEFVGMGIFTYWWTGTENPADPFYQSALAKTIAHSTFFINPGTNQKTTHMSVRCIKGSPEG